MKPKEFYKILIEFVEEDKRWRALKVGDTIYEKVGRGDNMDYHKMTIDKIYLEKRKVKVHDAEGDHNDKLSYFLTQTEFEEL